MSETKNPYQMNLIEANQTKLYNPGAFWAFNTAKYRALLSNDSVVIKYWYKYEAAKFLPDAYNLFELKRSFYYGDEFTENAEEFFGIIPMICESIAKLVCGGGYDFDETVPPEIKERLRPILDWDDEAIYKEANLIYAEKQLNIQVVDRTKPLEESTVLQTPPEEEDRKSVV